MAFKAPSAEHAPYYHRALDFDALCREYPPAHEFKDTAARLARLELRALQERRFLEQVKRAWSIPFYQQHWGAAGLAPADIRTLDDLHRIPPFSVVDLRLAQSRNPPWGDLIGIDPEADEALPLLFHTSGGTTGTPRPMMFTPRDREVMNIMGSRRFYEQGVRPFDRVMITLALGLPNAGLLARESLWKYSGALPIMTGTGANTPTRRQIELIRAWQVNVLVGLGAYLRHMAAVANDELKVDSRRLGVERLISWLGADDRAALEDLWDCDVYDGYGTNELGTVAAECACKNGMHVFEDAFIAEINDLGTHAPKRDGEQGVLFITALFKQAAPMIRFNTNDLSAFAPAPCACGSSHQRLERIYGRADNMVKLRGTNVFPEGVAALLTDEAELSGEYLCLVDGDASGFDRMTVQVETRPSHERSEDLLHRLERRLAEGLGVKVGVELLEQGALRLQTLVDSAAKPRRLIDRRKEKASA